MNELKKELRWFTIMDYEKEAAYLSKRHQEGWAFKHVSFPGIYTFEKCKPENIIYQLDYNKDGLKNQNEYVQMFEDCGWKYLLNFAGYSYFRKPMTNMQQKEEIFCDDSSRLDMINRIFRGKMIPLIVIFICLVINGYTSMMGHDSHRITLVFGVLMIIYMIVFLQFAVKYISFRQKIRK